MSELNLQDDAEFESGLDAMFGAAKNPLALKAPDIMSEDDDEFNAALDALAAKAKSKPRKVENVTDFTRLLIGGAVDMLDMPFSVFGSTPGKNSIDFFLFDKDKEPQGFLANYAKLIGSGGGVFGLAQRSGSIALNIAKKDRTWFQNMLADAARNPRLSAAFELTASAGAAGEIGRAHV